MPSITSFNIAHLHLILNHVPTVGSGVALALLLLALIRGSEALKIAALEITFMIAVITLPVYMSGVTAHREIRKLPGVSETATKVHQDAALTAFTVAEFAGFIAWIALWQSRRHGRASRGLVPAVTLLSIVSIALMARAATLGGDIRHPEIANSDPAAIAAVGAATAEAAAPAKGVEGAEAAKAADGAEGAEVEDPFVASAISVYMVNSPWAWPAAETVHFLGLSLSFGVLLAVNLRMLGLMKHVPFADVHRLLPWGMLGFGANLITGMLFFVGQPNQYSQSAPFYWKVVFLMIAGANFLYLTVFKKAWTEGGLDSSTGDKAMALLSMCAWLAVLYAGRMLPFLGNAF